MEQFGIVELAVWLEAGLPWEIQEAHEIFAHLLLEKAEGGGLFDNEELRVQAEEQAWKEL